MRRSTRIQTGTDPVRIRPTSRAAMVVVLVVCMVATALTLTSSATALPPPAVDQPIPNLVVTDGQNSMNASALLNGAVGTTTDASWSNSGNRWSDASYEMNAQIDLGATYTLNTVQFFSGQIPYPATARLDLSVSNDGVNWSTPVSATNPTYDTWSTMSSASGATARYVRISFASRDAHFNISELSLRGTLVGPIGPTVVAPIVGIEAIDGTNSGDATRMVDGVTGPDFGSSWWNPRFWDQANYPMVADLDLGGLFVVSGIDYFVGHLQPDTNRLIIEASTQASGENFTPLITVSGGHVWNSWRAVALPETAARRVRLTFENPQERFNLSEVQVLGAPAEPTVPVVVPVTAPPVTAPAVTTPAVTTPAASQPQAGPPPAGIVRSYGFGSWPGEHLTQACRDRHDSYWTLGPNAGATDDPNHPDNMAYHTWHPAIDGECDFGHEHGTNPMAAGPEVFALSGGWPAFGWAAEHAAAAHEGPMQRHEDHVGHKVTVAQFRAAIGNAANINDTLWDAGFDCIWLSKIHQGSWSLDAFSNQLHEYYLTLQCNDGLSPAGVVDNTVVGTQFATKVMYTYGEANHFVEENCTSGVPDDPIGNPAGVGVNDQIFASSILTGPEGQPIPTAHRPDVVGNNEPNNRAFVCSSAVLWQDLETQVQYTDIWNELIKIQRNDGTTGLTIQPYYMVKNSSRIIEAYEGKKSDWEPGDYFEVPTNVVRTISICYNDFGQRLDTAYCADAPAVEPDWNSTETPFNGSFRAIHFKSSNQSNADGPDAFCTDAFGHQVIDPLPCEPGNITQYIAAFTNHWNDGEYSYDGHQGNIHGSIRATSPHGDVFEAEPRPTGGYAGYRLGYEFIIDNRDPDDNFDGIPDGAHLRGQN